MKQSGKLSGNTFTVKSNGETKSYRVEEKHSARTMDISEDVRQTYTHTTRIAYDEDGNRAGTVENGRTGLSHTLNTNNR